MSVNNQLPHIANSYLTDYNYSFCEEADTLPNIENYSFHTRLQHLQTLLKKQLQLHQRDRQLIRHQAQQINIMHLQINQIHNKIIPNNTHSLSSKMIGSRQSNTFDDQQNSSKNSFSDKLSSKRSIKQKKMKKSCTKMYPNENFNQSNHNPKNNNELLTSIVQRKVKIQRQLQERFNKHLKKQQNVKKTLYRF